MKQILLDLVYLFIKNWVNHHPEDILLIFLVVWSHSYTKFDIQPLKLKLAQALCWLTKKSRKIFWLAERHWTFDQRWRCHIRIGQCKALRKITFFATPIVTPPGINQRRAFLIQSLEIGCEKDVLKICLWDFSYSVVNKNGRRVNCQDFCTLTEWPYPGTRSAVEVNQRAWWLWTYW